MSGHVRLAAAVCAAVLCAAAPALAQNPNRVTVRAMLGGGNEVPVVSAGAHGEAVVTVDRSAGTIDYEVNIFNLPSGIVGAHIHAATAGANGPVVNCCRFEPIFGNAGSRVRCRLRE